MKRIWIILLFLFSISLGFSLNYFLVPFDGYYWDVALSNMKPLFTPEEGVITKIIDPITFEISLRAQDDHRFLDRPEPIAVFGCGEIRGGRVREAAPGRESRRPVLRLAGP